MRSRRRACARWMHADRGRDAARAASSSSCSPRAPSSSSAHSSRSTPSSRPHTRAASTMGDAAFARAFVSLATTLDLLGNAIDDAVIARKRDADMPPALAQLAGARRAGPNVHLRAAAALLVASWRRRAPCSWTRPAKIDARASSVIPHEPPSIARRIARDAARHSAGFVRCAKRSRSRSLPARHGLRMGVAAAAVAVWLSFALDITRGYWATITTLIVLQPYTGATMRKTLQRVGGSVVGGVDRGSTRRRRAHEARHRGRHGAVHDRRRRGASAQLRRFRSPAHTCVRAAGRAASGRLGSRGAARREHAAGRRDRTRGRAAALARARARDLCAPAR